MLAALLFSAGCNPNWAPGESAKDTPPPWRAAHGERGNPHGAGNAGGGMPSMTKVVDELKKKVAADPKDVESWRQLGQALYETGQWDEAAALLQEGIAASPDDVSLRVLRARVLLRRRDQGAALVELEAAKKIAPDDEKLLREWGGYHIVAQDLPAAAESRKRLIEKHPDIADREQIERELYYLQRFPKLKDEGKLDTFFATAEASKVAMRNRRFDEAITLLLQVLTLLPDDPDHWTQLGVAQHESGKKTQGVASLRKALSYDKNHPEARVELARALAADGDRTGAIKVLQEWKKIDAKRADKHGATEIAARLEKGEPFDASSGAELAHGGGPAGGGNDGVAAAAGAQTIRGVVRVSPDVASRVPRNARLMIIAKASASERMPVAVLNQEGVSAFPATFTIGPENVMMQGTQLPPQMHLTARIEIDGQMGAGPGDLEGVAARMVPLGTAGVEIVIDRVIGEGGGGGATANAPMAAPGMSAGGSGGRIRGTITLAPALASKVPQGATLFVFAKTNPGPGAPLAVLRTAAPSSWARPVPFELSEENAMLEGIAFEGEVYLTARIDQDGMAGATPGDLEGVTKTPVAVGSDGVTLTIDTVR